MDELTSPQGAIALAVTALLLVLGYRLARPDRAREWLAVASYGAGLAAVLLGARGLLPGGPAAGGPALRVAGAILVVAGLLLAGKPARDRRRAATARTPRPGPGPSAAVGPVYAGLALVLAGQLARAPSVAGGIAAAATALVCLAVALTPEARGRA
jgi:hypothetical protein